MANPFEMAKRSYPQPWIAGYGTEWENGWDEYEEGQEIEVPHTFQLVDAVAASFRTPEREGMLVLQEQRPGCKTPFNHWRDMIAKDAIKRELYKVYSDETMRDIAQEAKCAIYML